MFSLQPRATSQLYLSLPKRDVRVKSVIPQFQTWCCKVANVEMGQSRHFALQKNSKLFRRSPTAVFLDAAGR